MKILIVDDSTINNILIQSILEDKGYETTAVLDGHEAFRKIDQYNPELIILDIMMPEISGFDVLKRLRNMDYSIPVIALSAYKDKKYEKHALSLGASAYLHKPVNPEVLFNTIEKCKVSQE